MKLTGRLTVGILVSVLLYGSSGLARALNPDWKFYGGVSSQNGQSWCFYDSTAVFRAPDGHLRIMAKCLPQTAMDDIDIESDFAGKITRNAKEKQHRHYMPPYAMTETITGSQSADIALLEAIADIANVEPRVKLSYELDRIQNLARELSLYVQVNGKIRTVDQPSEWRNISPEANTDRLHKILCRPAQAPLTR